MRVDELSNQIEKLLVDEGLSRKNANDLTSKILGTVLPLMKWSWDTPEQRVSQLESKQKTICDVIDKVVPDMRSLNGRQDELRGRIKVLENHVRDLNDSVNRLDLYIANLQVTVSDLEHRHEWWIRNIRQQLSEAGASLARPMPANPKDK